MPESYLTAFDPADRAWIAAVAEELGVAADRLAEWCFRSEDVSISQEENR